MVCLERFCLLVIVALLAPLQEAAAAAPDLTGVQLPQAQAVVARKAVSFAQEPHGLLAVAYFKNDASLYYFHYDDSAWVEELAVVNVNALGARNFLELLFVYDVPHIIYYDSRTDRLRHAWRTGAGTWSDEVIDAGAVGSYLAAAACGNGEICAAYYDIANGNLKFARGAAGAWSITTIDDSVDDVGQFPDVTLTTGGRPLVSYYNVTQQLPQVAQQNGLGQWSIEVLPGPAGYGRWTSIVQGSDGTTHLSAGSWNDATTAISDGTLYYAKKPAGGAWNVTPFDASYTSAYSSISLPAAARPHVAARHWMRSAVLGEVSSVFFAYQDDAAQWHRADLTPNDDTNYYGSIASMVDPWDNPRVAYYFAYGTYTAGLAVHGPRDSDGDGLPDNLEEQYDSNAAAADSDGDGLADGVEVLREGTSPAAADTDGDGGNDLNDKDGLDVSAANLVSDGSGERPGVDAWAALSQPKDFVKNRAAPAQGLRSFYIAGGGAYRGAAQRAIASAQSSRYLLRLYYRREVGTFRVRVGWGVDDDFEAAGFSDGDSSGWQLMTRYFTTPAADGDLRLLIDTDGSAFFDGIQLLPAPAGVDLDGDGASDAVDNCPGIANANQANIDGDNEGDVCDADRDGDEEQNSTDCAPDDNSRWRHWAYLDSDGDTFPDSAVTHIIACHGESAQGYTHDVSPVDNCPNDQNVDQQDSDSDNTGDACDVDIDGDGSPNGDDCAALDGARFRTLTYYDDSDGDQIPDDLTPHSICFGWGTPDDSTESASPLDNCPADANANQTDTDSDGIGDACDPTPNGPPAEEPTPSSTPESPSPSPSVSPSSAPTLLLHAVRKALRGKGRVRIVGRLHLDDAGETPIAGVAVTLRCAKSLTRVSSTDGTVGFTVKKLNVAQRCSLQAAGAAAVSLKIPRRAGE